MRWSCVCAERSTVRTYPSCSSLSGVSSSNEVVPSIAFSGVLVIASVHAIDVRPVHYWPHRSSCVVVARNSLFRRSRRVSSSLRFSSSCEYSMRRSTIEAFSMLPDNCCTCGAHQCGTFTPVSSGAMNTYDHTQNRHAGGDEGAAERVVLQVDNALQFVLLVHRKTEQRPHALLLHVLVVNEARLRKWK